MVGHNMLDEVIFLILCHMAEIMIKVAFSADMTSLATGL
jgi:hypothetical protein